MNYSSKQLPIWTYFGESLLFEGTAAATAATAAAEEFPAVSRPFPIAPKNQISRSGTSPHSDKIAEIYLSILTIGNE